MKEKAFTAIPHPDHTGKFGVERTNLLTGKKTLLPDIFDTIEDAASFAKQCNDEYYEDPK